MNSRYTAETRDRAIRDLTEDCRREWYSREPPDQDAELERLEGRAEYKARHGGDDDGRE